MIPGLSKELAGRFEYNLLDRLVTSIDLEELCADAIEATAHGVCVQSSRVSQAMALLEETELQIICAVGHPFGTADGDAKRYETEVALDCGAHEIDAYVNMGLLLDNQYKCLLRELRDLVESADERLVKIALDTRLLSPVELPEACQMILDSGAQFISLVSEDLTPADVAEVRRLVGPKFGIKAACMRSIDQMEDFIEAGANRAALISG